MCVAEDRGGTFKRPKRREGNPEAYVLYSIPALLIIAICRTFHLQYRIGKYNAVSDICLIIVSRKRMKR